MKQNFTPEELQLLREKVIFEVTNLRNFAEPKELAKLKAHLIDPTSAEDCIYGKITGCCFSKRALILIYNCANGIALTGILNTSSLKKAKPVIKTGKDSFKRNPSLARFWSEAMTPLEWWINNFKKDIPKIVSFLKNKNISELKLTNKFNETN